LEADWRSTFRSIPVMGLTENFEDRVEGKIDIHAVGLGPLSPATKKDFETLADIGSEALHNLPAEASLEVMESISRGRTPLAHALRMQFTSPESNDFPIEDWPLSPATKKEFETLTEIASDALHNLPEEASMEVMESISRGRTPLAHALRMQVMSSETETFQTSDAEANF
jgi:hypothetical protein